MSNYDVFIVGCGLSGMVVARTLADKGYKSLIVDRRNHIGGNIYDHVDSDGFLVQDYGPHCFFTNDERIKPFVEKYLPADDLYLKYRTVINGMKIPMPFNFTSIDMIYEKDKAEDLKDRLLKQFPDKKIVAITDLLESNDELIKEYGEFMYNNEYKLYSGKQWGLDISEISPSVFKRVPVYLSYEDVYQSSKWQFLPRGGFTLFSKKLLDSPNITIELNRDVIKEKIVEVIDDKLIVNHSGCSTNIPVLFTGALDELFNYKYGRLPYRSLEFIWKTADVDEYQPVEILAYPQADKITRVTEYKKLPVQNIKGKTKISIEVPVPFNESLPIGSEPYYPIKNDDNDNMYSRYFIEAKKVDNLFLAGRLADYKYYNMDMVISRAWEVANDILVTLKPF